MIAPPHRPAITIFSHDFVERVLEEARDILSEVGVFIENPDSYRLLLEHGADRTGPSGNQKGIGKLTIPPAMVDEALRTAPKDIRLWDVTGQNEVVLSDDKVHFVPGSAALYLHDPEAGKIRKPVSTDLHHFVRLVDQLPHYHLQSTALIGCDVPDACADSYRLYMALKFGCKPVVTGLFRKDSFDFMKEVLILVRGGKEPLKEKPLAIFDACPSPPLMWSDLTAHSVIQAARWGIPSEFVSMPLTGSMAPVTLSGAIVQHAAETLSGVVLAQCAKPGAPVIWGGSPSAMDLRYGTTPMGAIETMMIDMAYAAVGKSLGLPTHAYMGLSDSKQVDYQAGMESAMGMILAALAGINVVSGPGMLDFESCQSLEKLVLDHEVCGMAYRLLEGIVQRDEIMALDLLKSLPAGGHLLTNPHTLKWFRQEIWSPGKAIDRRARGSDSLAELPCASKRARQEVERILASKSEPALNEDKVRELDGMMLGELKKAGGDALPSIEGPLLPAKAGH